MRSWIGDSRSLAVVVMMQKLRKISPVSGWLQLSQMPASANGSPLRMPIAYGCFGPFACTLAHSKKLSTGTSARRLA